MWDIFNKIGQDHTLNVNGSHWSAIINAVGCVGKDLEKAEQIFAGIATHPAVRKSKHPLPDSVCFEAIFNVLLAHHRFDKCEHYLRLMHERNVQMTAYIANLLIRGYAASGDLAGARSMFESMSDAPFGVAAPDNHEPQNSVKSFHIPANSTVYREVRCY
jgi:pentatricopeptide repeat protein